MQHSAIFSSSRASTTLLAAVALAAPACATTPDPAPLPGDFSSSGEPAEAVPDASRVVATVDAPDGARLVFLDEGDGGAEAAIGVEILSSTATPVTDALLDQAPTPLELYLALAPAAKVPAALVADHERTHAAAPRHLAVSSATGETSGYYNCDNSAAWAASFRAWAPVLDGEYVSGAPLSGTFTGYVGYSPTFYFDVCRPADVVTPASAYYTSVQRRASSSASWTQINSSPYALYSEYGRWRYYRTSTTCSGYQHRLVVNSVVVANEYRLAARWADEWSCQISP